VPHLLASALAGALPAELFDLTATGFRDTTRVAAGDPELWTAIFAANRAAMLDALGTVGARLDEFRRALDERDWTTIDSLLAHARKVRHALGS
jgi:prephenate dehydrogenase